MLRKGVFLKILVKFGLKSLSIIWCLGLFWVAAGICLRWISVYPQDPILVVDHAAALLLGVTAVLSLRESRIALCVSAVLILACSTIGAWGIVIQDMRCLPGLVWGGVGLVYGIVKLFEYKLVNRRTVTLLGASILLAGTVVSYLWQQRCARLNALKQTIVQNDLGQAVNGDFSCLLDQLGDAKLVFLGESPHYTVEIRQAVMELSVYLAEHANVRVLGCESLYGSHPFMESESMDPNGPAQYISPKVLNYNKGVPDELKLLVTALDIEHAINHSKQRTVKFLNHLAERSSSDEGQEEIKQFIPELTSAQDRDQLHAFLDELEGLFNAHKVTFGAEDWDGISAAFEIMRASVDYQMSLKRKGDYWRGRGKMMSMQEIRATYFRKTVERALAKAEERGGKLICYVGGMHAVKTPLEWYGQYFYPRAEANYFNQVHARTKGRVASVLLHALSFEGKAFERSSDLDDIVYELMGDADQFYLPLAALEKESGALAWSRYFTNSGPKYDGVLFFKDVTRAPRQRSREASQSSFWLLVVGCWFKPFRPLRSLRGAKLSPSLGAILNPCVLEGRIER